VFLLMRGADFPQMIVDSGEALSTTTMPDEISVFSTQAGHKRRAGKLILSYVNGDI